MEQLNEIVQRAIEKRKRAGFFTSEPVTTRCRDCNEEIPAVPAFCWGHKVEGFWMSDAHEHSPLFDKGSSVSTEVRQTADFVVIVAGRPCFITASEREEYLTQYSRALERSLPVIIEIRGYVFDRLYPILPYDEWSAEEFRRDRRVEAVKAID
jgi:hypothetical protein